MNAIVTRQRNAQRHIERTLMTFWMRGAFGDAQVMQKVVIPLQKWKIAANMPDRVSSVVIGLLVKSVCRSSYEMGVPLMAFVKMRR